MLSWSKLLFSEKYDRYAELKVCPALQVFAQDTPLCMKPSGIAVGWQCRNQIRKEEMTKGLEVKISFIFTSCLILSVPISSCLYFTLIHQKLISFWCLPLECCSLSFRNYGCLVCRCVVIISNYLNLCNHLQLALWQRCDAMLLLKWDLECFLITCL